MTFLSLIVIILSICHWPKILQKYHTCTSVFDALFQCKSATRSLQNRIIDQSWLILQNVGPIKLSLKEKCRVKKTESLCFLLTLFQYFINMVLLLFFIIIAIIMIIVIALLNILFWKNTETSEESASISKCV